MLNASFDKKLKHVGMALCDTYYKVGSVVGFFYVVKEKKPKDYKEAIKHFAPEFQFCTTARVIEQMNEDYSLGKQSGITQTLATIFGKSYYSVWEDLDKTKGV